MTTILKYIKYPISIGFLAVLLNGCFESDYTRLVKSELAKGIRKDSVLLGINLGMSNQDFNTRCFILNDAHLITQGEDFSVQYLFTDSLVHKQSTPMKLLFVPAFDSKGIISNMDLKFSYNGWSPWNENLQADSLKAKVIDLLMMWYKGNEFLSTEVNDHPVTVKLDGNRRILVMKFDEQSVVVRVQDILHPKYRHSVEIDVEK